MANELFQSSSSKGDHDQEGGNERERALHSNVKLLLTAQVDDPRGRGEQSLKLLLYVW